MTNTRPQFTCKQCGLAFVFHNDDDLKAVDGRIRLVCKHCGADMVSEHTPPPPPPPQTSPGYTLSGRDGDLDLLPIVVLIGGAFIVGLTCFVFKLNAEHGLLGYFVAAAFYYTFLKIRVKR